MLLWLSVATLAAWLTLLGPPATLLAWLTGGSVPLALGVSLVLAPVAMFLMMRALRSNNDLSRWLWVQAFGLGSILMPLWLLGLILTLFMPAHIVGLMILCIWPMMAAWAVHLAHRIHDFRLTVHAPQLQRPMRLVQISDVHIGSRSARFLERVLQQAEAHRPEVLLITGDLLDTHGVTEKELAALKSFKAPMYMCLGNHERYVDLDAAIHAIEACGVVVLRNAAAHHDQVQLIGIDDQDKPHHVAEILSGLERSAENFQVLLYHRPDGWQAALDHAIDLTLAGHTHGGQIWPFGWLVKREYPDMVGHFERNGRTLFVSSGTGTWGPTMRLGTRCEMTVIDLDPARPI